MISRILSTLFIISFSFSLLAQKVVIPNYPTAEEKRQMEGYLKGYSNRNPNSIPTPPPSPVRTMAEWEEIQAILITWTGFPDILREIVRHSVNECKVIIVTTNPASVTSFLQAGNVPMDNVEFLQEPFNSVWIRDYGPWAVYQNDVDSLMLVDWIYNRPRPLDDAIPTGVAEHFNLPIYEATVAPNDWVHTGGNNLRDGMGTIFSSKLVLEENPGKTEAQIDQIAADYLGATNYVKFETLPYDAIHHLDMHMRVIDEETIIFGAYPPGIADGPQINENIEYLLNEHSTAFGNPYRIIRMPMPPDETDRYPHQGGKYRTYTNSIFVNKTILVPVYEEQYDTTALRIYRENLPGYNVVGIDCNSIIGSLGALHCITKLVGVPDPLWIAHARLRDTYETTGTYPLSAIIKHRSGIANATLHYRVFPETNYTAVPMTLADEAASLWEAAIPAQADGSKIQYYIHATAHSGKEQVRPMVAPEGYFEFRVDALVVNFSASPSSTCIGSSVQFQDNSLGEVIAWNWVFPGGVPLTSNEANPLVTYNEAGTYSATLIVHTPLQSDTLTLNNIVSIGAGIEPYFEQFDEALITSNWIVENPNSDNAEWVHYEQELCYEGAIFIDNFNNDTRNTSDFFRASFDLSELSDVALRFDVAYAPYDADFFDELKVNVIDCEGNKTTVFTKAGTELATSLATTALFTPAGCGEWRQESIELSAFEGQQITVEFENAGGYGNALYIDNVDISSPSLVNQAPLASFILPVEGDLYADDAVALQVQVEADDEDGVVRSVVFEVNGTLLATDSEPPFEAVFMADAFGTYLFEATAIDDDGAWGLAAPVEVNLLPLEVIDLPNGGSLQIQAYPNPVKDWLKLELKSSTSSEISMTLLNSLGQELQQRQLSLLVGESAYQWNMANLPVGAYQLTIRSENQIKTIKIQVNH